MDDKLLEEELDLEYQEVLRKLVEEYPDFQPDQSKKEILEKQLSTLLSLTRRKGISDLRRVACEDTRMARVRNFVKRSPYIADPIKVVEEVARRMATNEKASLASKRGKKRDTVDPRSAERDGLRD